METLENVTKTYTDPVTGKFLPGNPGGGRPKGSFSIKERIRQYLDENPDKLEEIVNHFVNDNRELMWQMLEGRPSQDVTSGGEKLPTPILGASINVQSNESST